MLDNDYELSDEIQRMLIEYKEYYEYTSPFENEITWIEEWKVANPDEEVDGNKYLFNF